MKIFTKTGFVFAPKSTQQNTILLKVEGIKLAENENLNQFEAASTPGVHDTTVSIERWNNFGASLSMLPMLDCFHICILASLYNGAIEDMFIY